MKTTFNFIKWVKELGQQWRIALPLAFSGWVLGGSLCEGFSDPYLQRCVWEEGGVRNSLLRIETGGVVGEVRGLWQMAQPSFWVGALWIFFLLLLQPWQEPEVESLSRNHYHRPFC